MFTPRNTTQAMRTCKPQLHAITRMTLTNITMSKRSQTRRSAHSWRQLLKLEKPVRSVATLEGQVTTWKEVLGAVASRPECWLCLCPLCENSPTHTLNSCPFTIYTCALMLYFKIKFTTRQNATSSSCTPLRNLTLRNYRQHFSKSFLTDFRVSPKHWTSRKTWRWPSRRGCSLLTQPGTTRFQVWVLTTGTLATGLQGPDPGVCYHLTSALSISLS